METLEFSREKIMLIIQGLHGYCLNKLKHTGEKEKIEKINKIIEKLISTLREN